MSDLRKVTESIEREEFARGHIAPGDTPTVPRPAATCIVACLPRDEGPARVLLLRRPETARFAAGAYVFPGGVIDPEDASPEAMALVPGRLRCVEGAAAVAALRELFEETGFLPTDRPVERHAALRAREALLRGEAGFAETMSGIGASFEDLRAAYISRWITPARFTRRYDTRFFLLLLREDPPPRPELTGELCGHLWIDPRQAVREFSAGRLPMLFPTRKTLETLAGESDLESLMDEAAGREPSPTEPRLLVRDDTVRPVLPGDPDFDEAE